MSLPGSTGAVPPAAAIAATQPAGPAATKGASPPEEKNGFQGLMSELLGASSAGGSGTAPGDSGMPGQPVSGALRTTRDGAELRGAVSGPPPIGQPVSDPPAPGVSAPESGARLAPGLAGVELAGAGSKHPAGTAPQGGPAVTAAQAANGQQDAGKSIALAVRDLKSVDLKSGRSKSESLESGSNTVAAGKGAVSKLSGAVAASAAAPPSAAVTGGFSLTAAVAAQVPGATAAGPAAPGSGASGKSRSSGLAGLATPGSTGQGAGLGAGQGTGLGAGLGASLEATLRPGLAASSATGKEAGQGGAKGAGVPATGDRNTSTSGTDSAGQANASSDPGSVSSSDPILGKAGTGPRGASGALLAHLPSAAKPGTARGAEAVAQSVARPPAAPFGPGAQQAVPQWQAVTGSLAPGSSGPGLAVPVVSGAMPAAPGATSAGQGSGPALSSAAAPPAAALERMDNAADGQSVSVLRSAPHQVSVGVRDPALGWVEVRTQSAAGQVSASIVTASAEAHAAMAAHAPALAQYLAENRVTVNSLDIRQDASRTGSQDSPGQGAQQQAGGGTQQQGSAGYSVPEAARQAARPMAPPTSREGAADLRGSSGGPVFMPVRFGFSTRA